MDKSLDGVRVIDLGHVLAMPTCTMILADLGAEVIKVEPPWGDDARDFGPWLGKPGKNRSGYFASLNRNKKSLALDTHKDKGKEILRELIKVSDVVAENFRPTTMAKMGFGWEEIHRLNPRVIYASICGFGHDSLEEYASRPAYDMVAQAYSGLMSVTGPIGGPPCRAGTSVGDITAGHLCATAILAALIYRDESGEGQYIDMAMVDGLFSTLINPFNYYVVDGIVSKAQGTRDSHVTPSQAFKTKDGLITIPAKNDELWKQYCEIIGRDDLVNDPKFITNQARTENRDELTGILEVEMVKKTTGEWLELFHYECNSNVGFPASPVNSVRDMVESPLAEYRKHVAYVQPPGLDKVGIAGSPFHLSGTPGVVRTPAPRVGQDSHEVLKSVLGYTEEEIVKLEEEKVVVPNLEI